MFSNKFQRQWSLGEDTNISNFEAWKHNLTYILTLDENFSPFLKATWTKSSKKDPHRGFKDDTAANVTDADKRKSAATKVNQLELMLGQIANWAPDISRRSIVERSTSLENVWQIIRNYYGIQLCGSYFLDLAEFNLRPGERPEALFQRLMSFVEDNLLTADGSLSHHGDKIEENEELTPTLENMIVLIWLQLIHKDLPKVVKQKYGTELRTRTLASIKNEISASLNSLLDEVNSSSTSARVMRSSVPYQQSRKQVRFSGETRPRSPSRQGRSTNMSCAICKAKGKPHNHFLSSCSYLPESDRKFFTKSRLVQALDSALEDCEIDDETGNESDGYYEEEPNVNRIRIEPPLALVNRVEVERSPWFNAFKGHQSTTITVDCGSQVDLIREAHALSLNAKINRACQGATQADGRSPLDVVGETFIQFTRGDMVLNFHGLVCRNMNDDILAGMPFLKQNDIVLRAKTDELMFSDGSKFNYGETHESKGIVRRTQAHVLKTPTTTTIFPGDYLEVDLPEEYSFEKFPLAIEPRVSPGHENWLLPTLTRPVNGKIRLVNETREPQKVPKGNHLVQVMHSARPKLEASVPEVKEESCRKVTLGKNALHSTAICINRSNLSPGIVSAFENLHNKYDDVFNPIISGYNGASGDIKGTVNMGPVLPPQRKGRVPQYSKNRMDELQAKCDELEEMGVLAKPESVGVVAEYLSPSFLVKKPSGGHRLVTAFAEVAKYSKPQPSLMPNVDNTMRQIGRWKHIISTDLHKAFYQIPLAKSSIKFCGIVTPYKGVRVYLRCAMGLPGSETALEELMSRVLGEFIQEGFVAKVADDLYVGSDTPEGLVKNWERILVELDRNNIKLSASKTLVGPVSAVILGWLWKEGTLTATPHRISTLATCVQPKTVKGLRSFLGAYKFLSRVLPQSSSILAPLEEVIAGKTSSEKLSWTSELDSHFTNAKNYLSNAKTITIPKPEDKLWIVTDGAQKLPGIGAAMFITRGSKRHIAGHYSAKLNKRQLGWFPCEIEALAITAAISHYSPYIVQSQIQSCVLTDSKPCVDAYAKLCRGEFSVSARVMTYLSTVSRYQCEVKHISGSKNLFSDFQSQNAPECDNPTCQICLFITKLESCVVRSVNVRDVIDGSISMPFTSRSAWRLAQEECSDIRQAKAQLRQGTRPSKKVTDKRDVKQYLKVCTLARDGLLIVRREAPFSAATECTVVPRALVHGLITAVHLKFDHPSAHQMKQIMRRSFYAIAMDQAIDQVVNKCPQCASLKTFPKHLIEQSTESPPCVVGINFAADVLRRERQFILLLREYVTSYLQALIISDEKHDTLRSGLIQLSLPLLPTSGPKSIVRVDPAPGFHALIDDKCLLQHNIVIEMGRIKNLNKNPIAERAVQEFENELAKDFPSKILSPVEVTLICTRINQKIRYPGISSKEMLTKRDQFSNVQLNVDDMELIITKHKQHLENHRSSAVSKASGPAPSDKNIAVGDLVYLYSDPISKGKQRERYIVASIDNEWCNVRKFTNSQLRAMSYRVKKSHCYPVPCYQHKPSARPDTTNYEEIDEDLSPDPCVPQIPLHNTYVPSQESTPNDTDLQPEVEVQTEVEAQPEVDNPLENDIAAPMSESIEPRQRPQRERRRPRYLEDYAC